MRLLDSVAIVTGGGRGIGKAAALAFAREGAHVAVAARTSSEIEQVKELIQALGRRSLAIRCDVSKEDQVELMVNQVIDEFGTVDILVNNAAIHIRAPVVAMSVDDWDHTMAVNLRGPFLCMRAVLPIMMKQRRGKIINIASEAGRKGWATGSAYCASKFGLLGLTEAVSDEVADEYGVQVNALCVGGVDTLMSRQALSSLEIEWEKMMQPEDIAHMCIFLASDESRGIYGAFIDIYGLPSTR